MKLILLAIMAFGQSSYAKELCRYYVHLGKMEQLGALALPQNLSVPFLLKEGIHNKVKGVKKEGRVMQLEQTEGHLKWSIAAPSINNLDGAYWEKRYDILLSQGKWKPLKGGLEQMSYFDKNFYNTFQFEFVITRDCLKGKSTILSLKDLEARTSP